MDEDAPTAEPKKVLVVLQREGRQFRLVSVIGTQPVQLIVMLRGTADPEPSPPPTEVYSPELVSEEEFRRRLLASLLPQLDVASAIVG